MEENSQKNLGPCLNNKPTRNLGTNIRNFSQHLSADFKTQSESLPKFSITQIREILRTVGEQMLKFVADGETMTPAPDALTAAETIKNVILCLQRKSLNSRKYSSRKHGTEQTVQHLLQSASYLDSVISKYLQDIETTNEEGHDLSFTDMFLDEPDIKEVEQKLTISNTEVESSKSTLKSRTKECAISNRKITFAKQLTNIYQDNETSQISLALSSPSTKSTKGTTNFPVKRQRPAEMSTELNGSQFKFRRGTQRKCDSKMNLLFHENKYTSNSSTQNSKKFKPNVTKAGSKFNFETEVQRTSSTNTPTIPEQQDMDFLRKDGDSHDMNYSHPNHQNLHFRRSNEGLIDNNVYPSNNLPFNNFTLTIPGPESSEDEQHDVANVDSKIDEFYGSEVAQNPVNYQYSQSQISSPPEINYPNSQFEPYSNMNVIQPTPVLYDVFNRENEPLGVGISIEDLDTSKISYTQSHVIPQYKMPSSQYSSNQCENLPDASKHTLSVLHKTQELAPTFKGENENSTIRGAADLSVHNQSQLHNEGYNQSYSIIEPSFDCIESSGFDNNYKRIDYSATLNNELSGTDAAHCLSKSAQHGTSITLRSTDQNQPNRYQVESIHSSKFEKSSDNRMQPEIMNKNIQEIQANNTTIGIVKAPENINPQNMISTKNNDSVDASSSRELKLNLPYNQKPLKCIDNSHITPNLSHNLNYSWNYHFHSANNHCPSSQQTPLVNNDKRNMTNESTSTKESEVIFEECNNLSWASNNLPNSSTFNRSSQCDLNSRTGNSSETPGVEHVFWKTSLADSLNRGGRTNTKVVGINAEQMKSTSHGIETEAAEKDLEECTAFMQGVTQKSTRSNSEEIDDILNSIETIRIPQECELIEAIDICELVNDKAFVW